MSDTQSLLTIIGSVKNASDDKKQKALEKIFPLLEIVLLNTDVFNEILDLFVQENSEGIFEHIHAIEQRSESSANKIIDATHDISQNLLDVPEYQRKKIEGSINEIYEGCNFQDLVSQHAKEIHRLIKSTQEDMAYIKKVISSPCTANDIRRPVQKVRDNQHLLNGPTTDVEY